MAEHEVSGSVSTLVEDAHHALDALDATGAVVAALDGSAADEPVADWAADEASRLTAPLRLVSVVDAGLQLMPYEALVSTTPSLARQLEESAHLFLGRVASHVRERRPDLDVAIAVTWGSPAAGVLELARPAIRLVVGAPRKGPLERVLLGSVALPVVAHARCPVAVVPTGTVVEPLRRLVVGVDGSEASSTAVELAFATASSAGAAVTCVIGWHLEVQDGVVVTERGSDRWAAVEERHVGRARRVVDPVAERFPHVAFDVVVRHGPPSRVLVDAGAELGADALVVASRGLGGFRGLLLGSVSRRVIEHAGRVVVVAR